VSDKIKIIRIFIGSPGGLDEERKVARSVIDEINLSNSEHWKCEFKLVGWEDTIPGYQRPQDKINEDLDKCEYFIGVLANRWGSRPSSSDSEYTSGFEEELSRATKHIEDGRMKDLAIYFKNIPIPDGLEPKEEFRRVIDFRKKCVDEKKIFFKDFSILDEFRSLIRKKVMEIGWRETEISSEEPENESQPERAPLEAKEADKTSSPSMYLIDGSAREFLSDILSRTPAWEETNAHDIARFRLIASAVSRSGNDNSYIGNHDANLIFQKLRDVALSNKEITALIDCGVAGFGYQNVPLWHWVSKAKAGGGL